MEALIRPGLGANNWTSRTNYPACGIIPTGKGPTGEGEMSIFVQRVGESITPEVSNELKSRLVNPV